MTFRPLHWLPLAALVVSGCAPLPDLLNFHHDTIVGLDVALESDVAFAGVAPSRSRITMLRRFVRSSEVHDVAASLGTLMGSTNLSTLKLTAAGSRSDTSKGDSGTALLIDPTQDLRRLQERVADATHLFLEDPIDAARFIVTPDHSPMEPRTIAAIEYFVPDESGVNFRPRLFLSPTQAEPAKRLENQPSAGGAVAIRAVGLSIYQVGRTGTADRLLWTWTGEIGAR